MPDYSKGKVYKLQCEDGHYYIGSTCDRLSNRLCRHKVDSLRYESRLYAYIKTIGWECVRIVLIEEFPCESKEQLIRKEDEHIRHHQFDPMCLNTKGSAPATAETRAEQCRQKSKRYAETHREQRKAYMKAYYERKKLSAGNNAS
jgi:predicted GIY-YIG superfamily endonuclease